jgi:hypothetical protein
VFSQQLSLYFTEGTGLVMLVGGFLYGFQKLRSANNMNYEKETQRELVKGEERLGRRFRYFAVLGAALSPDLSILPIFLLAAPFGFGFAFDTAVVFGLASVIALPTFLILGMAGLARAFERIPPKFNDSLVGFVIAAVGVYILIAG